MIPRRRANRARPGRLWPAVAVAMCALPWSCGNKGNPRPPEFVRPERIEDLAATPSRTGIRLTWTRPTKTVDGNDMPDLDGFVVSRATGATPVESAHFETIATIHLDDRERFAKVHRMTYDDLRVTPGETYLYRVVAFTLDGYVGGPSRVARAQSSGSAQEAASE